MEKALKWARSSILISSTNEAPFYCTKASSKAKAFNPLCVFFVWLSALPAAVLATSSVLSPAPWCPPLPLRVCTLSPPLPARIVLSLALLAPGRASSQNALTCPTGKLARGARWVRKGLLESKKSSSANHSFNNTFWWLVDFNKSHLWIWTGAFFTFRGNEFVYVCVFTSARRPVEQEWWSAEWSAWPQKAKRPNSVVCQRDLSLRLRVRKENVGGKMECNGRCRCFMWKQPSLILKTLCFALFLHNKLLKASWSDHLVEQ